MARLEALVNKLDQLKDLIKSYDSCLVAYSGGVDSVFLAYLAHLVLGDRALAVIADSESLPRRELEEALALGRQFGFPVRVIRTEEFANPDYVANPANRCFFCKEALFSKLAPLAQEEGFRVIAYGENASDLGDYRPGAEAAKQFEVRAPLKEIGLSKGEIRQYSAQLGLPTAEKPQMACLSSRIPHGEKVTPAKLLQIEAAENKLRDMGFFDVRVRHHEIGPDQALARIEVGEEDLDRLGNPETRRKLAEALREAGYLYGTVDLMGYRRGSLNPDSPARVSSGEKSGK